MQRGVDIDGHVVHAGATVQVKWLGVWYEGTVIKIGPKKNLCRVRDVASKETILLMSKHLQFMETCVLDKHISAGEHVAYKDGNQWKKGVVESISAVGAMMVSWRKSGLSEESVTWFELSHITPVIHNELYEEHNRDILEAGKSGLLYNDAIEPRPRTMDNMLYESGSDDDEDHLAAELAESKISQTMSRANHTKKVNRRDLFEEPTKDPIKERSTPFPAPLIPPQSSYPFPPTPIFMPFPPMMHPYGHMYLPVDQNHYMKVSPSFTSASHSFKSMLPHPLSVKKPGLSHASVPCIRSYTASTNGIPPHPSSRFFQSLRNAEFGKRKPTKPSRAHSKSKLKKSPSVESQAHSEPTQYTTIAEALDEHTVEVPNQHDAMEQKPVTVQTPTHAHTKHSSHSTQPHNITTFPIHNTPPQIQPSAKGISTEHKSKLDHHRTLPPPLPPCHPPSRVTAAVKQSQSITTQESLHRGGMASAAGHPGSAVVTEQEMSEEEDNGYEIIEHKQTQGNQDQGAILGVVSASPAHVTVPHGGSTLLTCVAKSSHDTHYEWFKDGTPISENDPFFTEPAPGMLQIEMASMYLTGEYKCVAKDNHSSFERIFHLTVCLDTKTSDDHHQHGPSSTAGYQPQFFQVSPKESSMDSIQPVTAAETHPSSIHARSHTELPIIIVDEPQSEPTTSASPHTPLPSSSGRDTSDIRDGDDVVDKSTDNVATEQKTTGGRKTARRNRRRVSNALKNDIEQYLEGYGENYGEMSSKVDFALEPWLEDLLEEDTAEGQKEKKRKRKKTKKSLSRRSSSPTRPTNSLKKPECPKQPRMTAKLPSALFGKGKKKQVEKEQAPLRPSNAWQERMTPTKSEDPSAEKNPSSVLVHTSMGANSPSDVSLGEVEREGRSRMQETLNDSIHPLQLSVEESYPEQFTNKEKKKGFLSPKNKMF